MISIIALIGYCTSVSSHILFNGTPRAQYQGIPGYQVAGIQNPQGSMYPHIYYPRTSQNFGQVSYPALSQSPWELARIPHVPDYTFVLKEYYEAAAEIKKHLDTVNDNAYSGLPESDPAIQYLTILHTIDQLITAVANHMPYTMLYVITVRNSILETAHNPLAAIKSLRARLDKDDGQTAGIRDLIQKKQAECQDPVSYECDLLIDRELQLNNNPIVKAQGKLLMARRQVIKLFNTIYAAEFDSVAKTNQAYQYLINGETHLKPLVKTGAEVREQSLTVRAL